MRCPVCGAKLVQKQICPYCKITSEQITTASNRKVKAYRKAGQKDLICFTNVIPSDVSKVKLWIYTILLGWLGINHLYVYRNVRGIYSIISSVGSIFMLILKLAINMGTGTGAVIFNYCYDIIFYMMAINVILWVFDIFNLLFKNFKVPVILPKKGE